MTIPGRRDATRDRKAPITKRDVITSLRQPKVAVMLMLGFSSGLPFFLTGNTLGYWMRDEGTALSAIGFLSWVGLAYSFKFLWAPFIDRLDAPGFGRLGRRRSWMVLTQLLIAIGLLAISSAGVQAGVADGALLIDFDYLQTTDTSGYNVYCDDGTGALLGGEGGGSAASGGAGGAGVGGG